MDDVQTSLIPFPSQGAAAWIAAYQEEMLHTRDEATIEAYTRILEKFAAWLSLRPGSSGQFHPQAITRTAIEGFLDTLPSFSYKKQARAALSGFCRWLHEDQQLLERNPARFVSIPAQALLAPRSLSKDQRYVIRELVEREADTSTEAWRMRKTIIRSVSMLGILFVLLAALMTIVRFYPYPYIFPTYPKITHTKSGAGGDPINLLFVGSKDQMTQSFRQAGWLIPDRITTQTSARIAVDSLAHRSYPTAPVSLLYVFGRVQDLAFEKPTTDVQNRGHIRIWKTSTHINGQPVWVGAATYDSGIELSSTTHFPTHHIAPPVDLERNVVGADLAKTGLVRDEAYAAFTAPILFARNGGGDYYESDGEVLVITYTQVPIPLTQPAWGIEGLKTGIFLFYDALFTGVGALMAFLVLVVVLIAGLALWQFTERHRPSKQT